MIKHLILTCMLLLSSHSVQSQAFSDTKETKTLIACGHQDYPPISWTDGQKIKGVAPILTKLIFEKIGFNVDLVYIGNWKRCLQEAKEGTVDIVVSAFQNIERSEYLLFSDEFIIEEPIFLFYNNLKPIKYKSWDDLKGLTVGLLLGDIYGEDFDDFLKKNTEIIRVSKGDQNFGMLKLGRIDFTPAGILSGNAQIKRMGISNQISATSKMLTSDYFYMAISKKSIATHHIDYVNAQIRLFRSNGTIDKLLKQEAKKYYD